MKAHTGSKTPVSERDNWETPFPVYNRICAVVNMEPMLDVCATSENRKAIFWYGLDVGIDSISAPWPTNKVLWMNPPYSDLATWTEKAAKEAKNGAIIVGLIPHSPDAKWFQKFVEAACPTVFLPDGRIQFKRPNGDIDQGNPKPSCVPIWAPWGNNGQPNYIRYKR